MTTQEITQENGSSSNVNAGTKKGTKTSASADGERAYSAYPKHVPFNTILINPAFNIRTMYPESEIKELADSIKEDGQETPLKVRYDDDGNVHLVSGFRRSLAFQLLKWGSKDVEVSFRIDKDDKKKPASIEERMGGAFLSNLRENLNRADVSYHDLAKRYWELETGFYVDKQGNILDVPEESEEEADASEAGEAGEAGEEGSKKTKKSGKKNEKNEKSNKLEGNIFQVKKDRKTISATTGHSVSHIGNLIRAWKNLSDDSKKVWQRGFMAAGKRHDLPLDIVFMIAKGDDGEPLNDEKQADVIARYIEAIEKQGGKRGAKKPRKNADGDEDATPLKRAAMQDCLGKLYEIESEGSLKGMEEAWHKGKIHAMRIALGEIGPQNIARKFS
jgi:ParB-like chromosome segregation protein Spo0J